MTAYVHIHAPPSYYLGQVRRRGAQRWRTVTGFCKTDIGAMTRAVAKMTTNDKRARVLWCTECGYYKPIVVMECAR